MNSIDAHKDELERLLVNLSGHAAVSGLAFVALLDVYISRLDADCPNLLQTLIRRRKLAENQQGTNIESELRAILKATRNCRRSRGILGKFSQRSSPNALHPLSGRSHARTWLRGWQ